MKGLLLVFCPLVVLSNLQAQERCILTSDCVRLYVNVKGKGTPCLYLHGGPGAGSYFLEKLVGDSLEEHFQMIYLDQRGSGRSTSPKDGNYAIDRMVKEFEEVRAALGIRKWVTLGHSFGGLLQMEYAERCPRVIDGMIMINCSLSIPDSFEKSWFPKACDLLNIEDRSFYLDPTVSIKARLDSLLSQLISQGIIWKMAFASTADLDWMNEQIRGVPRNTDFESAAFGVDDYLKDYLGATAKTPMPVLFFYGNSDWMVGPEHYTQVHFPNMLLWETTMAHMSPFIGDNRSAMAKAIEAYVTRYEFGPNRNRNELRCSDPCR